MNRIHVPHEAPKNLTKSLFLAGPSCRKPTQYNWRSEAVEILNEFGFTGAVFIPFTADLSEWNTVPFAEQLAWETEHLSLADVIVFWVPRDLSVTINVPADSSAELAMRMAAFTTNVEFGAWVGSGKAVLGFPVDAPKIAYLAHHARVQNVPIAHTLRDTLHIAVSRLGEGAERSGEERRVPLHIWRLPCFQRWYQGLQSQERLCKVGLPLRSGDRTLALHVQLSTATGVIDRVVVLAEHVPQEPTATTTAVYG